MSIPLKAPHHDVWLAPLDPSKLPGAKSRVLRFTSSIRPRQAGPNRSARLLLGAGIVLAALATYGIVRWLVR